MNEYIDKLKEENYKNIPGTFSLRTYGCQMNEHDSEYVKQLFLDMGYVEINEFEEADIMMINTCAIRETAEDKAFGYIGSLKNLKRVDPKRKIIISGCMPKVDSSLEEFLRAYEHIDILMGTNNYEKLPKLLYKSFKNNKTIVDTADYDKNEYSDINYSREYRHKSYVNITYGCNNFCTYCIVPYTRGRERSRSKMDILSEVENLVSSGVKEVTLLGQNVNSYGKSLRNGENFYELLREINKIEGLKRIRYMTSHPKDFSEEIITAYSELDKLCPQLHLPVQSGSDNILKAMNRKYKIDEYMDIIKKVKRINPNITLSTDIIVGFPGETDKDFNETLKVIEEVEFDNIFSFIYSPRKGTCAAKRKDQVEHKIKQSRLEQIMDLANNIAYKNNKKYIGTTERVLVDDQLNEIDGYLTGRTGGFKLVKFKGDSNLIGNIVNIKITNANSHSLEGLLDE